MSYDFLAQSHALNERLFGVWYAGADPDELRDDCAEWLNRVPQREQELRAMFKGSRMLPSQLDLLDKARERVRAVYWNCRKIA